MGTHGISRNSLVATYTSSESISPSAFGLQLDFPFFAQIVQKRGQHTVCQLKTASGRIVMIATPGLARRSAYPTDGQNFQ